MTRAPWPLLLAFGAACASRGNVRLEPAGEASQAFGELDVRSLAQVEHATTQGWELAVRLELEWRGQERSRIDLGRALVRVDGRAWEPCRPPPDQAREELLVTLDPGASRAVVLRCEDIAEPRSGLELRFPATNTGMSSGTIELSFLGVR